MRNAISFVFLFLLLRTPSHGNGSTQNDCTVFSVSSSCLQSPGGGTCFSLQVVLNKLASNISQPADCVEVELEAGLHVISQAVMIEGINISLIIRGEKNASSIECAPSVTLDLNHALYLDGLRSFSFERVAVYRCVRPIRISNVKDVTFRQSLFRYVEVLAYRIFCSAVDLYTILSNIQCDPSSEDTDGTYHYNIYSEPHHREH